MTVQKTLGPMTAGMVAVPLENLTDRPGRLWNFSIFFLEAMLLEAACLGVHFCLFNIKNEVYETYLFFFGGKG